MWTQGFRFSFTPLPGFFSPFLHSTVRYRSQRVFSLTGWSPLLPSRFHVSRCTLDPAPPLFPSPTGLSPSLAGFPKAIPLEIAVRSAVRTPACTHPGLGSFPFARRYLGNRCFFLFLRLLRCFSSPGSPPCVMCWRMDTWGLPPGGFPHSDTCGSPGMCPSPQLFAACRVFRRLLVPRHPPCALPA